MRSFFGDLSPLALQVWRRNLEVYLVTWRTAMLSLAEPALTFLAFGLGVGTLTKEVEWHGEIMKYDEFVAPGVIGMAILFQSFFEALFGSYVRMYYQRTFDAITATPASLDDVSVGEILWAATRGLIGMLATLIVLWTLGYARTPGVIAIPFLALAGGLLFGAAGFCFTAMVKNIESMSYAIHLVIVPMYLFGGLFFPVENMPGWAQPLAWLNPMTWLGAAIRDACRGDLGLHVWLTALGVGLAALPLMALALRLMRRRLIR